MNPKLPIDQEVAEDIINGLEANAKNKVPAPGSVPIHYDETGFFREVYADDYGVIEGIKKYVSYLPSYNLGQSLLRLTDSVRQESLYEDQSYANNVYHLYNRTDDSFLK